MSEARLLLEEFERRERAKERAKVLKHSIYSELFKQQQNVVNHRSRYKATLCTRRAGKTECWPRYSVATALENPKGLIRIWGPTRMRAKELQWSAIQDVCKRHKIPVRTNETDLTVTFRNGAIIRLVGADKEKDIEKKRGDKTVLDVVLEAQIHGRLLKSLVEDVIEPCLLDNLGTVVLEGTPGPICAGYWYEITKEKKGSEWTSTGAPDGTGAGWQCFHWSVLDNPYMQHAREELQVLKKKKRWSDDHPTYVREWLGRWVRDDEALYYRFDEVRNTYNPDEVQPWGPGWQHVLGWDIGAVDDMALVAWGWHPEFPALYEVASWKESGASVDRVMKEIAAWEKQGLNFTHMVADTGGVGKLTVNETMMRYNYQFEPAKKSEKAEHVRLMNDDFRSTPSFILCIPQSALAVELSELMCDPDVPEGEAPQEDSRCSNHCTDAALYAWRRAYHYLHEEARPRARPGTPAYNSEIEEELEQQARDAITRNTIIEERAIEDL